MFWAQACEITGNALDKGQGHAHFQGKLFVHLLVIPHPKPRTKFEISSSSSFGDVFDRMPKL